MWEEEDFHDVHDLLYSQLRIIFMHFLSETQPPYGTYQHKHFQSRLVHNSYYVQGSSTQYDEIKALDASF